MTGFITLLMGYVHVEIIGDHNSYIEVEVIRDVLKNNWKSATKCQNGYLSTYDKSQNGCPNILNLQYKI